MRFFYIFTLVISFLCMGAVCESRAQQDDSVYSDTEKAGFAFHHLSGAKPDFDSWITVTDRYRKARPPDKQDMLRRGAERLERGFINYSPDEDLVHVMADVVLHRYFPRPGSPEEAKAKTIDVVFEENDDALIYFPFNIGTVWVALIPDKPDLFRHLDLDEEEYAAFILQSGFSKTRRKEQPAVIEMWLKPIAVDMREPMMLEENDHWPMLAEVASVTLWDVAMQHAFWSYEAPWYQSDNHQQLLDLYSSGR